VRFSAKYLPSLWRFVLYQISNKGQEKRAKKIDQLKNQMKEVLGIVEKEQIKYIQEAPTKKERDKLRKEFLNYDNRR